MGPVEYSSDHVPAMKVPKGGSSCASCEYLKDPKKKICGNEYFIRWNQSEIIPGEIDAYCSDWYNPADKDRTRSPHGFLPLSSLRKGAKSEGESTVQERKEYQSGKE